MATLDDVLQTQLQQAWQEVTRQQQEITLLIEQTRLELERHTSAFEAVRSKLEALDRDLDRYSREELRDLFRAAKEREMRLVGLRGELEGLEYNRSVLAQEARALTRFGALVGGGGVPAGPRPGTGRAATDDSDIGALLLSQEADRGRLAHWLHDRVAQPLHHMVLRVELWQRLQETDPAKAALELEGIRPLATSVLQDARRAIFELRPMSLDDLG